MRSRWVAASAVLMLTLSACSSSEAIPVIVEDPWVRTTTDATDTSMTALFFSAVNPGQQDDRLVSADCSSVAGMSEVHEMVKGEDGTMVMREAPDGVKVPAGQHVHLKPGGEHVMLMKLTGPLDIGDEVTCTVTFEKTGTLTVTAPVKKFTEEEDHYHASASPAANG